MSYAAPVDLRNSTVRLIFMMHLAEQFDQFEPSRMSEYQSAGMTPAFIDRYRNLTVSDLLKLANTTREDSIQVLVNVPKLDSDMNRLEHLRADTQAYEYFIRNGASLNLIMELFTKRPSDIKRMQLLMGVATSAGRKALPADEHRVEILSVWHRMRSGTPWPQRAREDFIKLHQSYSHLSLAQLEGVLSTYKAHSHEATTQSKALTTKS